MHNQSNDDIVAIAESMIVGLYLKKTVQFDKSSTTRSSLGCFKNSNGPKKIFFFFVLIKFRVRYGTIQKTKNILLLGSTGRSPYSVPEYTYSI